jgi:hypothetical protein
MWQLTIRDSDEALRHRLRQVAQQEGLSLNRAAVRLLRRAVGLGAAESSPNAVGDSLDHLIGKWDEQEEEEFLRAIGWLERTDQALWS